MPRACAWTSLHPLRKFTVSSLYKEEHSNHKSSNQRLQNDKIRRNSNSYKSTKPGKVTYSNGNIMICCVRLVSGVRHRTRSPVVNDQPSKRRIVANDPATSEVLKFLTKVCRSIFVDNVEHQMLKVSKHSFDEVEIPDSNTKEHIPLRTWLAHLRRWRTVRRRHWIWKTAESTTGWLGQCPGNCKNESRWPSHPKQGLKATKYVQISTGKGPIFGSL